MCRALGDSASLVKRAGAFVISRLVRISIEHCARARAYTMGFSARIFTATRVLRAGTSDDFSMDDKFNIAAIFSLFRPR